MGSQLGVAEMSQSDNSGNLKISLYGSMAARAWQAAGY
jgi:hypothetical protein